MVENRKLQVTGGSTYIVSLPGRWVRDNGMEKGSSVSISEEFNILKIRPENYVEKEVARTIELGERYSEGLLNRILISSYIAGFDSLKINTRSYISNEQRDIVRKFTRVAMGVELLEETANSITLHSLCHFRKPSLYRLLGNQTQAEDGPAHHSGSLADICGNCRTCVVCQCYLLQ